MVYELKAWSVKGFPQNIFRTEEEALAFEQRRADDVTKKEMVKQLFKDNGIHDFGNVTIPTTYWFTHQLLDGPEYAFGRVDYTVPLTPTGHWESDRSECSCCGGCEHSIKFPVTELIRIIKEGRTSNDENGSD